LALDVGELVARLTVDDSRFIQGTQAAQQSAVQTSNRINSAFQGASRGINDLGTNAQQTARRMAEIELNRNLDRQAQNAATRLAELRENAQRAGQSAEQIALNESMIRDAVRATNEIEELRRNAEQAATSVRDIEVDGQLEARLRAAQQELDQVRQSANDSAEGVSRIGEAASSAVSGMARVGGAISSSAGNNTAGSFLAGFSDKLGDLAGKAGPIAGSLLGVAVLGLAAGAALASAIQDGMQEELNRDIFQAQTNTTAGQARKFALAAGESFADAFGESVEGNLSTLKLAIQNNIIDKGATQRDAEAVINSLETISTALDGEVSESVLAVSALMSTGLAGSAQEAADMIANAVGGSVNKGEDLLEIINEYAVGWKKAGISGEMAIALMEQATDAGLWTADNAGDALREWGRRMSEEGEAVVAALDDMGLAGQEMFDTMKAGGDDGAAAFDKMFDTLRAIEDPMKRSQAVAALLGDSAGDFYDIFENWDPSEALKNFGEFEGSAARLAGIMGGNAATSVQGAMNSISVASDGMKAALAQAFGPYIKDFADSISNNRAGVIQFFIDVGNAGFEMAKSIAGWAADALRSLGSIGEGAASMAAGVLRAIAPMAGAMDFFNNPLGLPGIESNEDKFNDMADAAESAGGKVKETMGGIAQSIDDNVIPGLDKAQERFNQFAGEMKLSAAFNDESAKVSKAISDIGIGADGNSIKIENWTGAIDRNNQAQVKMDDGLRGMADAFQNQIKTGMEAGNTVEALTGQYNENYVALIEQLMATGMNNQAAVDYLRVLGLTPEFVYTGIKPTGMPTAQSG